MSAPRPGADLAAGQRSDDGLADTADPPPPGTRPAGRLLRLTMQVLWPAFLVTVVAEGVLFSLVDPRELLVVDLHLADSREAAYTVAFFLLWALFALSSGLTWWLASPSEPPPRAG